MLLAAKFFTSKHVEDQEALSYKILRCTKRSYFSHSIYEFSNWVSVSLMTFKINLLYSLGLYPNHPSHHEPNFKFENSEIVNLYRWSLCQVSSLNLNRYLCWALIKQLSLLVSWINLYVFNDTTWYVWATYFLLH